MISTQVARDLAEAAGASVRTVEGDALLEGYPQIHAVGRAAGPKQQPRLIDLTWGSEDAPKVTLVGKGVCFDTGGLDIKPAAAMLTMKKDADAMPTVRQPSRPTGGRSLISTDSKGREVNT